ncbi:lipid IV(A) 4-amino-4-deoxy-L-arabinosyltransferase [Pseudomonas sp. NY15181]|uniref:lipid IV(A) 4-amino-4-deoxy-L-arabinosyltransferase n=1 Tax=Pseudomonas sp. NY15181 TaxID=3400349 RepID=UPI003A85B97A
MKDITLNSQRALKSHTPSIQSALPTAAYPALLIAFVVFFLAPLGAHGLWIPDETRYAQAAQELLQSGNWAAPHFLGLRYFEKPIGGYWLIAIGQALFGDNLFGARIASALTSAATVGLIWLLGRRLWNDAWKTWTASLLYMSFGLAAGQAGYANIDPQLTLWITLGLVACWFAMEGETPRERWAGWALLGVACAMGFMTKGFLAWLLPVIVVGPYALLHKRWRELLKGGPLAIVLAVLLSLPWAIMVHQREADFWQFFFWNEHIRRFAGTHAQHAAPFWFFVPLLFAGALPWALLVVPSLRRAWRERTEPRIAFLSLWFAMPFLFFSLSKGKLPTYILPCFVPLALLMANTLVDKLRQGDLLAITRNGLLNLGMGSVALLGLVVIQVAHPIYTNQPLQIGLALVVCLAWMVCGCIQWKRPAHYWFAPALGLWVLVALLPAAMPLSVVDNKMPDQFISRHLDALKASKSLLSNELGAASALAWRLDRSDVTLLDVQGELQYGLAYPDAADRQVTSENMERWLALHTAQGPVGIVLSLSGKPGGTVPSWIPRGAEVYRENNLLIVIAQAQKAPLAASPPGTPRG